MFSAPKPGVPVANALPFLFFHKSIHKSIFSGKFSVLSIAFKWMFFGNFGPIAGCFFPSLGHEPARAASGLLSASPRGRLVPHSAAFCAAAPARFHSALCGFSRELALIRRRGAGGAARQRGAARERGSSGCSLWAPGCKAGAELLQKTRTRIWGFQAGRSRCRICCVVSNRRGRRWRHNGVHARWNWSPHAAPCNLLVDSLPTHVCFDRLCSTKSISGSGEASPSERFL